MDAVGLVVTSLGLLFVSVVVLLVRAAVVRGGLDRNGAVGIRTKATQRSDAAWDAGHRSAVPWLWASGLTGLVTGGGGLVVAVLVAVLDRGSPALLAVPGVGYVAVVALLVRGGLAADAAARGAAG